MAKSFSFQDNPLPSNEMINFQFVWCVSTVSHIRASTIYVMFKGWWSCTSMTTASFMPSND